MHWKGSNKNIALKVKQVVQTVAVSLSVLTAFYLVFLVVSVLVTSARMRIFMDKIIMR